MLPFLLSELCMLEANGELADGERAGRLEALELLLVGLSRSARGAGGGARNIPEAEVI